MTMDTARRRLMTASAVTRVAGDKTIWSAVDARRTPELCYLLEGRQTALAP